MVCPRELCSYPNPNPHATDSCKMKIGPYEVTLAFLKPNASVCCYNFVPDGQDAHHHSSISSSSLQF